MFWFIASCFLVAMGLRRLWRWHKETKQWLWDNAVMYDWEYDTTFMNHPLHPNYKNRKRE